MQTPPSQPLSSPVISNQAQPILIKFSLTGTMTIQNKPSETSEMSGSSEHVALLSDNKDTPPTIPCDTTFEESSSLMMKSSSYDNVSDDV